MKRPIMQGRKRVFICSPLKPKGNTAARRAADLRRNQENARLACEYALNRGVMPLAPHLYFPQFLSDSDPEEREMGMQLGLEWLESCDELWIIGRRITEGMEREIDVAEDLGIPVVLIDLYEEPVVSKSSRHFIGDAAYDCGYDDFDYDYFLDDEEGLLYDGD